MARPPAPFRDEDDDDAPWLAEGVREERSTLVPRARLFGGTLIALALAVLVGLGVYLASGHKSDGSSGYARAEDAPLIAADAGPYKLSPTDPGGAQITGLDETMAAAASGRDVGSAILPDTPEEPLARPVAGEPAPAVAPPVAPPTDLLPATIPPVSAPVPTVPTPVPTRAIPIAPIVAPIVTPAVKPQPVPVAKPVVKAETKPDARPAAKTEAVSPKVEPAKARTPAADPLASPPVKVATATATRAARFDPAQSNAPDTAKAAAPDTVKADATAKGGSVALQLGAFSTRDKADAAWGKASGDGALAGLAKRIEPIDRDGATLYRLRAGGVASRAAAAALCGRIRSAGNACIVAE